MTTPFLPIMFDPLPGSANHLSPSCWRHERISKLTKDASSLSFKSGFFQRLARFIATPRPSRTLTQIQEIIRASRPLALRTSSMKARIVISASSASRASCLRIHFGLGT
jgi:hypothetical protein